MFKPHLICFNKQAPPENSSEASRTSAEARLSIVHTYHSVHCPCGTKNVARLGGCGREQRCDLRDRSQDGAARLCPCERVLHSYVRLQSVELAKRPRSPQRTSTADGGANSQPNSRDTLFLHAELRISQAVITYAA